MWHGMVWYRIVLCGDPILEAGGMTTGWSLEDVFYFKDQQRRCSTSTRTVASQHRGSHRWTGSPHPW